MTTYQLLYNQALNLLARRRYTVCELKKALCRKSIKLTRSSANEEEIGKIISRLQELKYLNDNEYAVLYLQDQLRSKPQGLMMLKVKMKKKGLETSTIDQALQKNQIDEFEQAKQAMKKKSKTLSKYPPLKQKEKLYRFLIARGFSNKTISELLF
jgi:regulatory protein